MYEKKKRKISIIMAIYNCAPTLREAIDSIIAQTYTNWELILCDDCSTDDTAAIAQEYVDKYDNILLIKNEHNMRLAASLNHCLEYAESEYIGRMDGDDISLPERFEVEVAFLDAHPEYALVSCQMICFDETGDWGLLSNVEKPTKMDFVKKSPFCHAPVLMRRSVLNEIGNYSVMKMLQRGQDFYLWHKFYKAGYKGYNLQQPLYKMRDDANAAKRRTFRDRIYSAQRTYHVFKGLNLPLWCYSVILTTLVKGLVPQFIYRRIHKKLHN